MALEGTLRTWRNIAPSTITHESFETFRETNFRTRNYHPRVVLNITAAGGFIYVLSQDFSKTYCLEVGKPDANGDVLITPRLEIEPVS